MKNIECEERAMLTFDQYRRLISYYVAKYPDHEILYIENTYLDDKELSLKNIHHVLRIRKVNNDTELTLKIKGDDGDTEINETPEHHPEIDKALNYQFDTYQPIAKLHTKRIEVHQDDFLVIIDMNTYNGIIDYDLEVEAKTMNRAKEAILMICKQFDIAYKKGYRSKSSRAIASRK